jgi:hypothetical protein
MTKETASGWTDMPIGVHRIPETSVYVSGHQGAAGIGALFGPIGLAAAHAAAQSTGEKKAGDPAALRIDIAAEADRVLKEELDRRREVARFATAGDRADATLEIVPFIVLTFIGEERVRPWVVLKARLLDLGGDEKWKTRYITSLGAPRPLTGDTGWTSDGGQPLRSVIDRSLKRGIDVMLRDAVGALPRGKGRVAPRQLGLGEADDGGLLGDEAGRRRRHRLRRHQHRGAGRAHHQRFRHRPITRRSTASGGGLSGLVVPPFPRYRGPCRPAAVVSVRAWF